MRRSRSTYSRSATQSDEVRSDCLPAVDAAGCRRQARNFAGKAGAFRLPVGMAVMDDGKTVVIHQTEPPYGFPCDKALYQVSL